MEKITKEELKEKYGRTMTIEVTVPCLETFQDKDMEFRFKMPKAGDQDRLVTEIAKNKMKAMSNICMSTVIDEDREALKSSFEDYPGLPATIAERIMKILGFGDGFLKAE